MNIQKATVSGTTISKKERDSWPDQKLVVKKRQGYHGPYQEELPILPPLYVSP